MTALQPTRRPRLVVIGNGMAAGRALEELIRLAPTRYQITVFGAEPHGNYNRIQLSPVLAGDKTLAEIMLNERAWYTGQGIELHAGLSVTTIDRDQRQIIAADGRSTPYDVLLLATGARPRRLSLPGAGLAGVLTFRTIEDVSQMLAAVQAGCRQAVVIGGGLLGLEAAYGLRQQGLDVQLIHLKSHLMDRQLDAPAARLLLRHVQALGIQVELQAESEALLGENGRVRALRLQDGRILPAELVVMTAGIQPRIELAQAAGLAVERGVVVNAKLQTSDPHIYALGECVQHRGICYGLVAPLWQQAKVVAEQLAGRQTAQFIGTIPATTLKVTGVDVFSGGDFHAGPGREVLTLNDPQAGIYKKLVLQQGRLLGVVLVGDTRLGPWYLAQLGQNVSTLRDDLMFGPVDAAA